MRAKHARGERVDRRMRAKHARGERIDRRMRTKHARGREGLQAASKALNPKPSLRSTLNQTLKPLLFEIDPETTFILGEVRFIADSS